MCPKGSRCRDIHRGKTFLCCNRGFAGAALGIGSPRVLNGVARQLSGQIKQASNCPQAHGLSGLQFLAEEWPRTIAMKRTFQPSKIRRARTHGFLVRMKSRGGRKVINSRRAKGRKRLAV